MEMMKFHLVLRLMTNRLIIEPLTMFVKVIVFFVTISRFLIVFFCSLLDQTMKNRQTMKNF